MKGPQLSFFYRSCVQLNLHDSTDCFDILNDVGQCDPLSLTLFSLYINDLAKHLKEKGPVVSIDNLSDSCILYADDMVLIAEMEEKSQSYWT